MVERDGCRAVHFDVIGIEVDAEVSFYKDYHHVALNFKEGVVELSQPARHLGCYVAVIARIVDHAEVGRYVFEQIDGFGIQVIINIVLWFFHCEVM